MNKELAKKVIDLIESVGAVGKDGFNDFQNYKYQSQAGIAKKLQPQLVKHGLFIYPSDFQVIHNSVTPTKNAKGVDKLVTKVIIRQEYIVTDGESSFVIVGIGEGEDSGDKASYKAQAGGWKYAVKGLLSLPEEADDPEADTKTDERHASQVKPQQVKGNTDDIPFDPELTPAEELKAFQDWVEKAPLDQLAGGFADFSRRVAGHQMVLAQGWRAVSARKGGAV